MSLYEVTSEEIIEAMTMPIEQARIVTAELEAAYLPLKEFIPNLGPNQAGQAVNRAETGVVARGIVSALGLRLVTPEDRPDTIQYRVAPRIIREEGFTLRSLALWVRLPEDREPGL